MQPTVDEEQATPTSVQVEIDNEDLDEVLQPVVTEILGDTPTQIPINDSPAIPPA